MSIPNDVFDIIDGKAQIFVSQPKPPYSIGDLWFDSSTADIMTCVTARESGSYVAGDWQKRNKYTDDSAVKAVSKELGDFITAYDEEMEKISNSIDKKKQKHGIRQPTHPCSGRERPKKRCWITPERPLRTAPARQS